MTPQRVVNQWSHAGVAGVTKPCHGCVSREAHRVPIGGLLVTAIYSWLIGEATGRRRQYPNRRGSKKTA